MKCLLSCLLICVFATINFGQHLRLTNEAQDFKNVKGMHSFDFSSAKLEEIIKKKSTQLVLDVELPNMPMSTVKLMRSQKFNHTRFLDADNNRIDFKPLIYTGHFQNSKSLISLTFDDDGVFGIISVDGKNWNLSKDSTLKKQFMFSDDILPLELYDGCEFKDSEEDIIIDPAGNNVVELIDNQDKSIALSVVDVYLQADFELFTDFGSDTTSALSYVSSLMTTVNILFNSADIDLNFPDIKLWTSLDPYNAPDASSSGQVLDRLICVLDGNYNGRIAHLVSTVSKFGGIANRKSSCPYNKPLYGFSRIFTNFNTDINIYSWSVNVIAHEIGHNLSSHHTHACRWNGDDTQIDDCGNTLSTTNGSDSNCNGIIDDVDEAEGSDCYDINNPILPMKGTIMSYCHAVGGVGVDLSLGFHPQVAARMKSFVDNCLSPTATTYCPIVDTTEIQITYPTPNSMQLMCTRIADVDTYAWKYKADISCEESIIVTTTLPVLVVENLYGNTPYEVECVIRCSSTLGYGDWSCPKTAHTSTCSPVQVLSGIVDGEEILEQAGLTIHSDQQFINGASVNYLFGNEANLNQGFLVNLGATFHAMVRSCE